MDITGKIEEVNQSDSLLLVVFYADWSPHCEWIEPLLHEFEKPVRTLSIESIRERLQLIHAHGIKNVRVLDRTFNYNPRRAKELLRLFLEFHPDIRFHLEIHPALLSEELKEELSLLPKGLLHLEAGIQRLTR